MSPDDAARLFDAMQVHAHTGLRFPVYGDTVRQVIYSRRWGRLHTH